MNQHETETVATYRWIKLIRHCELTGDTAEAVHSRRKKAQWRDGVESRKGPDGNIYINPERWNQWIEQQ